MDQHRFVGQQGNDLAAVRARIGDAEYLMIQSQLRLFVGLVKDLDLDGFIDRAETANAWGPYVDPTLWRDAHKNLDRITELARGLRSFQLLARKIADGLEPEPLPTEGGRC